MTHRMQSSEFGATSVIQCYSTLKGDELHCVENHCWIVGDKPPPEAFFHAKTALLTYFREKWVYKVSRATLEGLSIDEAVALVETMVAHEQIVKEIGEHVEELVKQMKPVHWSWSYELCPLTFERSRELRGHLHLVFDWSERRHIRAAEAFMLGGLAMPVHSRFDSQRLSHKARNPTVANRNLTGPARIQTAIRLTFASPARDKNLTILLPF